MARGRKKKTGAETADASGPWQNHMKNTRCGGSDPNGHPLGEANRFETQNNVLHMFFSCARSGAVSVRAGLGQGRRIVPAHYANQCWAQLSCAVSPDLRQTAETDLGRILGSQLYEFPLDLAEIACPNGYALTEVDAA